MHRDTNCRAALACLLCLTAASPSVAQQRGGIPQVALLKEFRPIGGAGNNAAHPALDAVPGNPELAFAPLHFAPGAGNRLVPGPNPRTISNVIAGGTGANGQNDQTTDPTLSAWLYVFGQFVDHDLDLEETPPPPGGARIDIVVPPGDPNPKFAAGTVIAMTRDTRRPRTNTIVNTVAGYLDLSQLYGSTGAVAASLANADGTLKSSDKGLALPLLNGLNGQFVTGDPRVMENPELTALTILFMREHNSWVAALRAQHPDWSGMQLYGMAKAITTAEYQNIVYNEYLPALIGPVLGPYRGYDPTVNAQVTQEFSTAAFRVGHSQVSDTQDGIDNSGREVFSEALSDAFFNTPAMDISNGIDPLLNSLGQDFSQATDVYSVAALRNLLFAGLVGGGIDQIDLIAIDIQRERDVGLGTLNQTRRALRMQPYTSFAQLTDDRALRANFQTVYGTIDNVDLFMGGLAEKHAPGANVGPTFQFIIASQFWRLRNGDRFYWQNEGFDLRTGSLIANTTLGSILRRDTTIANVQANVFLQSAPVTHTKSHAASPSVIRTRGRRPPFLNDGT
jgi:peroxidase